MAYETPALHRFRAALEAAFPGIKMDSYNRRPIAGSTRWSQHSWPNAGDIYFTHYGDTSAAHQTRLAKVRSWIRRYERQDEINHVLWLVKDHFDHIHIDFWPAGYSVPSWVRGGASNLYKTVDGTIITQRTLDTTEEVDELALLSEADQQRLVNFLDALDSVDSNEYFVIPALSLIRKERKIRLHEHVEVETPEPFNPDDFEIIIRRKGV